MSAGHDDRDLQGDGPARAVRRALPALASCRARHALGHTRMATESRVTTEHSHPFSTGLDLCLVHNGSLSNHNRLRRELRREGIVFQTDNDSEVAAGYLTWRLREGATPRAGARGLPRRPRRLLHLPRRHASTASRCSATRSPASPRCSPRPTTGWRWRRSTARSPCCRAPTSARTWEPEPGKVYSWRARARMTRDAAPRRGLRPRRGRRCASSTSGCTTSRAERPGPHILVRNPRGAHAVACGLDADVEVEIEGHVGYYCAGMNKRATVRVHGNAGVGVAENMMSGLVVVDGNASQAAGATGARRPARRARRRRRRAAASR